MPQKCPRRNPPAPISSEKNTHTRLHAHQTNTRIARAASTQRRKETTHTSWDPLTPFVRVNLITIIRPDDPSSLALAVYATGERYHRAVAGAKSFSFYTYTHPPHPNSRSRSGYTTLCHTPEGEKGSPQGSLPGRLHFLGQSPRLEALLNATQAGLPGTRRSLNLAAPGGAFPCEGSLSSSCSPEMPTASEAA